MPRAESVRTHAETDKLASFAAIGHRLRAKLNRRKASDEVGLLDRRGSVDSALTVATTVSQSSIEEPGTPRDDDEAGRLLDVLAPLVSKLQHLGIFMSNWSISSVGLQGSRPSDDLFLVTCEALQSLLESLQKALTPAGAPPPDHPMSDHDMASAMLAALIKKVEAERDRLTPPATNVPMPKSRRTASASPSGSPLHTTPPDNPFVLHSASPTRQSPGGTVTPNGGGGKSIPNLQARPIRAGLTTSFSAFASQSQSTSWATNLIRVGSFQNSFLFSQSPVAVKRPGK